MYHLVLPVLFLTLPFCSWAESVTNSNKCCRLGDHLVELAETIWLGDQHNLRVYLNPFENSDKFVFSDVFPERTLYRYKKHVYDLEPLKSIGENKETMYVVHLVDPILSRPAKKFQFNWKDPVFLERVRGLFSLKKPVATVPVPEGITSVAVHFRTGRKYDSTGMKKAVAAKFSSFPFVVESLEELYRYFGESPLYVHVFSDDPEPQEILGKLQSKVLHSNITWGVSSYSKPSKGIFQDFFSMMKFDCLVTTSSNFSFMVWVLGDIPITIRQTEAHYDSGEILVDRYEVVGNNNELIPFTINYTGNTSRWKKFP